MTSKKSNPPVATDGLGICDRQAAKFYDPESNPPLAQNQGRRALWLSRRYRLAPTMAAVVADLYFLEVAR
jgi:hypothetical protein